VNQHRGEPGSIARVRRRRGADRCVRVVAVSFSRRRSRHRDSQSRTVAPAARDYGMNGTKKPHGALHRAARIAFQLRFMAKSIATPAVSSALP